MQIQQAQIPKPYYDLLTQPLMTIAIERYYGNTPVIQPLVARLDLDNNIYYRSIIMLVANHKKNVIVAEHAYIVMNFNELPDELIFKILNTNIPFGKLLKIYDLPITASNQEYFVINCQSSGITYGRTNTILRADNHNWLAHVIEVLGHDYIDKKDIKYNFS